ncbi:MAG: SUMF1/EgtB/PvdO family nonheme iron enzyme [Lentisphaeria bacterium]|nr:SUMF1/EgtB/PvdO family nonheme iron enzyme [Lentisphaeria bacterium]
MRENPYNGSQAEDGDGDSNKTVDHSTDNYSDDDSNKTVDHSTDDYSDDDSNRTADHSTDDYSDDDSNRTADHSTDSNYDKKANRLLEKTDDAGQHKKEKRWKKDDLILDRYVVKKELGEGGMGVVYCCWDKTGNTEVAVKGLSPEISHSAKEMANVRNNYRLVTKLIDKNIVACKTLEEDKSTGNYYLVMEYVEGEDMRRWMNRMRAEGNMTLETALPVLRQIASALDTAHEQNIIHRDVKPENVMIKYDGTVKVLDFGLAAQIQSSLSQVSSKYAVNAGTNAYKSPEQWSGCSQDAAADQYALAVTAYEMLSGHLPFKNSNLDMLKRAVLNDPPEKIARLPHYVNKALMRGLAKNPSNRFATCADFVLALDGDKATCVWLFMALAMVICVVVGFALKILPQKQMAMTSPINESNITPQDSPTSSSPVNDVGNVLPKKRNPVASLEGFDGIVKLPGNVELKMVEIKAGNFTMGSPEDEPGHDKDETLHQVKLTDDFWMGIYEVTQEQYKSIMGRNPSYNLKGGKYPVENVTWKDAKDFCDKLTEQEHSAGRLKGWIFALPTEAQWEYACRAGTTSAYNFKDGSHINMDKANYDHNDSWKERSNRKDTTVEVGSYSDYPNKWGLYDMHGNVWEWCRDSCNMDEQYKIIIDKYESGIENPCGESGKFHVYRGGGWSLNAQFCRSAERSCFGESVRFFSLGFRLALIPEQ